MALRTCYPVRASYAPVWDADVHSHRLGVFVLAPHVRRALPGNCQAMLGLVTAGAAAVLISARRRHDRLAATIETFATTGKARARKVVRCADSETSAATTSQDNSATQSRMVLHASVALCALFMAFWILVYPGSLWVGSSLEADAIAAVDFKVGGVDLFVSGLVYKYNVMGQTAAFTHVLPGMVWALLAPLQLSASMRRFEGGALHRTGGRMMLLAAAIAMVGYAIIDENHLSAQEADFSGSGGAISDTIDAFATTMAPTGFPPFNISALRVIALWFAFTGAKTAQTAISKDYMEHQSWALRHIGAGLWISGQRVLFGAARALQSALFGLDGAMSPDLMADAFYIGGYVAIFAYLFAAEWGIQQNAADSTASVNDS